LLYENLRLIHLTIDIFYRHYYSNTVILRISYSIGTNGQQLIYRCNCQTIHSIQYKTTKSNYFVTHREQPRKQCFTKVL